MMTYVILFKNVPVYYERLYITAPERRGASSRINGSQQTPIKGTHAIGLFNKLLRGVITGHCNK